ncbi:neuronal pentraxin receptor-like [Engraulis encrasicolus]|uniref:neuronal pentraxin receptor-like n=1 Tax=Engraulis encrasicolus TaxID=184585 RepID=UPI002FD11AD7
MVAFIGAVICIIAAVHTGASSAALAQPLADNQSLAPDAGAQTLAPGGKVPARAGPVDALHGPDSNGRELGGGEAPTFYTVTGTTMGGPGGGGEQVIYSRLICTPVPAGECKPKNFQQQADDPTLYAGEDSGYLRTTADQLRQTVLQQKDEILTDQRTIRELTGKLTECERDMGMANGESPGKSAAAIWGGKRAEDGHIMVRDEAPSEMLAARAVQELEQAINQLRGRIEKLESEMAPQGHNHTAAPTIATPGSGSPMAVAVQQAGVPPAAPGGGAGEVQQQVEELEGELERKLQQLEQERRALGQHGQKHRQHIDQHINTVHQRLAGLERDSVAPHGFRLSFPPTSSSSRFSSPHGHVSAPTHNRVTTPYARATTPVPPLHALTACLWLRPLGTGLGTPLSYAVAGQPNELALLLGKHHTLELIINDQVALLPVNISVGVWQHMCVSWHRKGGQWKAYQGGRVCGEGAGVSPGHTIRPGGTLILGQEQDVVGGGFDASQALQGELSQLNVWDRALRPAEVSALAHCTQGLLGNVVPWREQHLEALGGATKDPGEPCAALRPSAKQ